MCGSSLVHETCRAAGRQKPSPKPMDASDGRDRVPCWLVWSLGLDLVVRSARIFFSSSLFVVEVWDKAGKRLVESGQVRLRRCR